MIYPNYEKLFYISDKNEKTVRLIPNAAQVDYTKKKTSRNLILKARQLGFTTIEKAADLGYFLRHENSSSLTVADTMDNAKKIFHKIKFMWDHLPKQLQEAYRIDTNNVSELASELWNSSIRVSTSGRSATLNRLHISEIAHMDRNTKEECITGSLEAVTKNGTVTIESTANGLDDFYYLCKEAQQGKGIWTFHFYGWNWDIDYAIEPPKDNKWKVEYKYIAQRYNLIRDIQANYKLSDAQFYWYYLKAQTLKERTPQEDPICWEEAFLYSGFHVFNSGVLKNIITKEPIILADDCIKIWVKPVEKHQYVIGADCSEGNINSDYSAAVVLDCKTGEIVAQLHGRWQPHIYAKKLIHTPSQQYMVL